MSEKYIITADRNHLRIYRFSQEPGQFTPSIQPVDAFDLPRQKSSYPSSESVSPFSLETGRMRDFASAEHSTISSEEDENAVEQLAGRITLFMEKHIHSTWDLAANPALYEQLVAALPHQVHERLNQVVSKDLVNVPPAELREHFTLR